MNEKTHDKINYYAGRNREDRPHESTQKAFERARELTLELGKALNGGDKGAIQYGILDGLLSEHRYLQSEMVFSLLNALGRWSTLESVTDARNEAAHETCKNIAKFDNLYFGD